MPVSSHYRPAPRFPAIGEGFFDPVAPANFPGLTLRYRNERWARRIGLDQLTHSEWLAHFGAFAPLPENLGQPLAMRYHGHQFRSYNPDIGDGRGFLHVQQLDTEDGRLLDLATKGSGQTPYSRTADGRLTLKGGVREMLITALLEALGVYTSKTFSLIETGEDLHRHDEPSPARSAVLVRLGHSHIRFGTFQRQAFEQRPDRLWQLVNFSIDHYFPDLAREDGREDGPDKVGRFLETVAQRTADLVAGWMAAGFVHGVLNTDNMNITGESFDYGPYRMLPVYDPRFVAAYFDEHGIYAYGRQPSAVFWNLKQLAGALSPICDKDTLTSALETFPQVYSASLVQKVHARLGLTPLGNDADGEFVSDLFEFLRLSQIGFERFFFDWHGGASSRLDRSPHHKLYQQTDFSDLRKRLEQRPVAATVDPSAAYFAGDRPCTLLIDEIEAIWADIADRDDWRACESKLAEIERMRRALNPDPADRGNSPA